MAETPLKNLLRTFPRLFAFIQREDSAFGRGAAGCCLRKHEKKEKPMKVNFDKPFCLCGICLAMAVGLLSVVSPHPASNQPIPILEFNHTPLRDAVALMARQAGMKIKFDPALLNEKMPEVVGDWRHVRAGQVLCALLDNYGWQMTEDAVSGGFRVSAAPACAVNPYCKTANILKTEPADETETDPVMLQVKFGHAPLSHVIQALAIQADLNIQFDPRVANKLNSLTAKACWRNITCRRALQEVLDQYGLQAVAVPGNPIYRITTKS